MTDEDILVEFEMEMIAQGEKKKECHKCHVETYRTQCPECGMTISGDALGDDAMEKMANGEDVDLNAIFGKKPTTVGMLPQ